MAIYGQGSNITQTTDATAGTYGSANQVGQITIDSDQRISGITNVSITASINANASTGDVGTYAFMQQASGNDTYNPGSTLAGSSLRYSDATGRLYTGTTPSGTWRCMGYDSGSALVNSGSGTGSGSGSGNVSGSVSGNVSVSGKGSYGLSSGTVNDGSASVNVNTNVSVNTEVAYSATLWMRYS